MPDFVRVETALLSVSDRHGLPELARALAARGVRLVATDSTGRYLSEHGIETTPVAQVTGFPEMLDGRVKTLHPRIHAGILANRDDPAHLEQLRETGIDPIDLVVVNLYPFREAVAAGEGWPQVVEQIDIGGPTLVRASAKNHLGVAIVVDPARYAALLEEFERTGGTSAQTRRALAAEAFAHTAAYDAAIATWMAREEPFPARITIALERVRSLRYGENPHQAAALYAEQDAPAGSLVRAEQLHGPETSYNNYLDADAAWTTVNDFDEPCCAIIKHATPCGVAIARDIEAAYERALDADRLSAFGGIVAVNRRLTLAVADAITDIKTDVVVAPSYDEDALELLRKRKNLRVLQVRTPPAPLPSYRRIDGGFLVQEPDRARYEREQMRVATEAQPTEDQWADLLFAWRVAKHVRSNAIVLARDGLTVGIGGGHVSRVGAAEIAARTAGDRAKGSVMASDGLFPFRDGVDAGVAAGAVAVIQPGGSIRDQEVIEAANEHGIPMVLTGFRHFRHG